MHATPHTERFLARSSSRRRPVAPAHRRGMLSRLALAVRSTPRFDDQVDRWERALERVPRRLDGPSV